ncbi:MAG TPA: tail fiber protein [Chlamydiales bacterium]|jgi:microcystin-dependent protein|nr:tail fiber protein [Chlamydiales bacterium]
MSAELTALDELAANFRSGIYRLTPTSLAVLFYATPYLIKRYNWIDRTVPLDEVTDAQWDVISSYVDGLLYEVKSPVIGYITPYITEFPPANVLPCDGSTYLRDDFPALYEAIDPFFIVDADHFTVPDLRGRTVIAAGAGGGLTDRSVGEVLGEETHQLTESELASHVHSIPLTATTLAVEPGEVAVLTPVPILTQSTGATGGDGAHNNMQPSYVLNYGVIAS